MNPGIERPDLHLYFMRMAWLVATRATCLRRAVGCVLVDRRGHVLSTGYNGVPRGEEHCNGPVPNRVSLEGRFKWDGTYLYPHACPGAASPSGTDLAACRAVHAEQNALLQCPDVEAIRTVYVTVAPCESCLKLFLNTGARTLVVGGWYADNEAAVRRAWGSASGERLVLLERAALS